MAKLSPEHTAFAVTMLEKLFKQRDLSQTWLEDQSGIAQSEISRILSHQKDPTKNELECLFQAIGIPLSEIVSTLETLPDNLLVYVATPLTGLVKNADSDRALRQFIARIEGVAKRHRFSKPDFQFYWPGNHTHPIAHASVPSKQVYITDRSRCSSYDLVVMFCAAPSCGIGQENEIATQAGVPSIRFIPDDFSRMMTGSFIKALDIPYEGSLREGIRFDETAFVNALIDVRKLYFVQQALFRGTGAFKFGDRLQQLVDDRVGSHQRFAEEIGIDPSYLEAMFSEPIVVCNPSAMLLMRMARRLHVSVAHLLWEDGLDDATHAGSIASWKAWVGETDGLDARTALTIRDNWVEEYTLHRYQTSDRFQSPQRILMKDDWAELYRKCYANRDNPEQIKQKISEHIVKESRIAVVETRQSIENASKDNSRRKIAKRRL